MTEWDDQERGLRDERAGAGSAGADPRVAPYRLIARVLREPIEDGLPDSFAAMVAARAETSTHAAADDRGVWLERAAFAGLAVMAIAVFGGGFVATLRQLIVDGGGGSPATQWPIAIGVCLTLTLLLDVWTTARTRLRSL